MIRSFVLDMLIDYGENNKGAGKTTESSVLEVKWKKMFQEGGSDRLGQMLLRIC